MKNKQVSVVLSEEERGMLQAMAEEDGRLALAAMVRRLIWMEWRRRRSDRVFAGEDGYGLS